jgi:SAM-dependent methyltransferase
VALDLSGCLKCPTCSGQLALSATQAACCGCGKSWPVSAGIPRFFEPLNYWGEILQIEARSLLEKAERQGWREAAKDFIKGNRDAEISLLDWQRASWLPLIGLDADSTALDIGCGYGAITHALSRGVQQVYSIEAISERIEFTRIRLEQEGVFNVQLVQASALDLPFGEAGFDLIVVNGVLEWVGEWTDVGRPREVQLGFLRKLHTLLKPGGVLLVGIENRFGYQFMQGGIDHSGLAYTSLMPRWVASWYLRHFLKKHHRTNLNPKREYRTYIYSRQGYRKLLRESGFGSLQFYWSDPGYNQPYHLVPLKAKLPAAHFRAKVLEPSRAGRERTWKRQFASLAVRAGLMNVLNPDFVILANKRSGKSDSRDSRLWVSLKAQIPHLPELDVPVLALSTRPFGDRSQIRVYGAGQPEPCCFIKCATASGTGRTTLETEYRALAAVHHRLSQLDKAPFRVPKPLGTAQVGKFFYAAEAVATGIQLSKLVFSANRERQYEILSRYLHRCTEAIIEFVQQAGVDVGRTARVVESSWWEVPSELESDSEVAQAVKQAHRENQAASHEQACVQHGDFTIENIFVEAKSGQLTVIDWENLMAGASPLYDLFTLLISALPAMDADSNRKEDLVDLWEGLFKATFLGGGRCAGLFQKLVAAACERLNIAPSLVWPMFIQFLLFRIHFYRPGSTMRDLFTRLLRLTVRSRDLFIPSR